MGQRFFTKTEKTKESGGFMKLKAEVFAGIQTLR